MNSKSNNQKKEMQQMMMDMCSQMSMKECQSMMMQMMNKKPDYGSLEMAGKLENEGTKELRALFFEWCNQIKEEMNQFMQSDGTKDIEKIAKHFKLSKDSCEFVLNRLT